VRNLFHIDPSVTYFNHGAFGSCPMEVINVYQDFQRKLEWNPTRWITEDGKAALNRSRRELAEYLDCAHQDLVYVPNPTAGLNAVMKSIDLEHGDEVLTTDQEYGALDKAWDFYCKESEASVVRSQIQLPITTKEEFLSQFWSGLSERTRVIFISHMTSATALILPVADICKRARELGILCIVDGAHVPGHVYLSIADLDPDIYTGANHKWLLAPKGNSFLYVKRTLQHLIEPLAISWGYDPDLSEENRFQSYHQYQGTMDYSAYLCTPACLDFIRRHDWNERTTESRALIQEYTPQLAEILACEPLAPPTDEWMGQMVSFFQPSIDFHKLRHHLQTEHRIEVAVNGLHDEDYFRLSCQPYNNRIELDRLVDIIDKYLRVNVK